MNPRIHVTRNNTLTGDNSPVGIITPDFIGQQYIMASQDKVFFAKGTTNQDWIEGSGSSNANDAVLEEIAEQLKEINNQRLRGIEAINSIIEKL